MLPLDLPSGASTTSEVKPQSPVGPTSTIKGCAILGLHYEPRDYSAAMRRPLAISLGNLDQSVRCPPPAETDG